MDGLIFFGVVLAIYYFVCLFNQTKHAEQTIRRMFRDKIEDAQRNMYTLSKSHQLIMERVHIEDMQLNADFVPMQQQFQLERWYNKVDNYSSQYFQSLSQIEQNQESGDNNIINFAQRCQPEYQQPPFNNQ
ncbi:MAG: hypothetical protein ACI8WB_004132 [Phenylobacterium sp.]|jgi:hypothetical protein